MELPEAITRGATALPRDARETVSRILDRLDGDYAEDEWGFDEGFAELVEPAFAFLYETWWRVQVTGAERVPAHGRALLTSNHAGILPWDATMISMALLREHPLPRYPRFLVLNWAFDLPWISAGMRKVGGVVASPFNAMRLLEQDQLVAVFPEGVKGTGKPYSERYRLQRFGRGGFVEIALRTGAPIVPVAVVGSEEIYPKLADLPAVARLIGAPYFPSRRPSRCSARSGSCRCRRSGGSSSSIRSRPPRTGRRAPTTGRSCSSCPSACATRFSRLCTRTSYEGVPPSSNGPIWPILR